MIEIHVAWVAFNGVLVILLGLAVAVLNVRLNMARDAYELTRQALKEASATNLELNRRLSLMTASERRRG